MLKPNKLYSCHLDDEFHKERESKVSPWKFLNTYYKVTKHFMERCNQRRIYTKTIVNVLKFGRKYYYFVDDILATKHIYENWGIVEHEGVLMTGVFFGKHDSAKSAFVRNNETFVFEEN